MIVYIFGDVALIAGRFSRPAHDVFEDESFLEYCVIGEISRAIISSLMMGGEEEEDALLKKSSFAFRNCNYSSFLCQSICKRELSSRNECCKNNVCCCVTLSNQMQISLC